MLIYSQLGDIGFLLLQFDQLTLLLILEDDEVSCGFVLHLERKLDGLIMDLIMLATAKGGLRQARILIVHTAVRANVWMMFFFICSLCCKFSCNCAKIHSFSAWKYLFSRSYPFHEFTFRCTRAHLLKSPNCEELFICLALYFMLIMRQITILNWLMKPVSLLKALFLGIVEPWTLCMMAVCAATSVLSDITFVSGLVDRFYGFIKWSL